MTDDGDLFDEPAPKPAPVAAQNWDPPERERVYYRRRDDGQLGWLVVRGGKSKIRLDRRAEEILRPFNDSEWIPEKEHRPLTRAQVAQVAYEADLKLQLMLGIFDGRRTPWQNLNEEYRIRWAENGPHSPPAVRKAMFNAIMGAVYRSGA